MILGIGNDIIEIERIRSSIEKYGEKFLNKMFTSAEQKYCLSHKKDPAKNFAGRFAAKEAFVKALGTGFREGVSWLDIEILNDEKGKPQVSVSPKLTKQTKNSNFFISISHCRDYATAMVVITATPNH